MPQMHKTDVAIVGGGLAGMTTAALLSTYGIRTVCIDRDDPALITQAQYDIRTTAISYGSQRVIAAAGAWEERILDPCPIRDIHIMDNGSPVLLEFLARDVQSDAFGWIVDNRALREALLKRLRALDNAVHLAPARVEDFTLAPDHVDVHLQGGDTVRAKLAIGADGRQSFTREWMDIPVRRWSYDQQAVVCLLHHRKPHHHIAVEHFMPDGPFAVLPMTDDQKGGHRSALVWSEHTKRRNKQDSMLSWDDDSFITALNRLMPEFYGGVTVIGPRAAYPLSLSHAYRYTGPRMALVADAAHGIHPIAGQGLNLGLRDIAELADLLVTANKTGGDLGADKLLHSYQRARRFDNVVMAGATDQINRLFATKNPLAALARKAGLAAVQRLPAAQRFFMRQAMGAPDAHLPRLIRDGTLD